MQVLHIIMYASKITTIFFLGNKNHGILFLYILVIVCANLTSNAVTFKRTAKYMSLLTVFTMITEHSHVDNYQAFSSRNSGFDSFCLNLLFLGSKKLINILSRCEY